MYKRTMTGILASLLLTVFVPTGLAAETVTATYDVPGGPGGNLGTAISWRIGDSAWDEEWWCLDDDDACEQAIDPVTTLAFGTARTLVLGDDGFNIGVQLRSSVCGDCYTNFLVTLSDTLPASPYFTFCVITEYQDGRVTADGTDNWCGEDPADTVPDDIADPSIEGCGSAQLTTDLLAGGDVNELTAFVYATFVDESTGAACFASSGTFTVALS